MNRHLCPKCDHATVGKKSRNDECFNEDGYRHDYIYCYWCDCLLFFKVNGKIEWSIWNNLKEGFKYEK